MFGFNCCRQTGTIDWIIPTLEQTDFHGGWAIRDDFWDTGWNDPTFKNLEFVSGPPRAFYGSYAYNLPRLTLPNGSSAEYGPCVIIGAKQAVYSGEASVQEFANTNFNQELVAYPFVFFMQDFPSIAQGTVISAAQLVLNRNPHVTEPPISIQAAARVWNNAAQYTAWPLNATQYPWSPTNTYGGEPFLGTQPFLGTHLFSVTGDQIVVDLTVDVQTVINRPSWSSTNCTITVLIYTVYPQADLWINSIHPLGNWPNYRATNTATWFTEFTPRTNPSVVPTQGAFVRLAI